MQLRFSRSLAVFGSLIVSSFLSLSVAESLLEAERSAILRGDSLGRELVGRRFIDAEDWSYAERGLVPEGDTFPRHYIDTDLTVPYYAYGQQAFEAFFTAYQEMVRRSGDRLPTSSDYLELHRTAARYHEQVSWYIQPRLDELKSSLRGAKLKALLAAEEREELLSTGLFDDILDEIFGKYRKKPPGSPGTLGNHVFTRPQLTALRRNFPGVKIEEYEETTEGRFRAVIHYPEAEEVEDRTQAVFGELDAAVAGRTTISLSETTSIASAFYRGLVITHGLVDVNGRMSKLMRDWVFYHLGHQPPLDTPRDDLVPTQAAFARVLRDASKRSALWVQEKIEGNCQDGLTAAGK